MSLKNKLAIFFSFIVTVILILNNSLHYISTKDLLQKDQERQMELLSKQIILAIEHSQLASRYVEDLVGEKLRIASLVAQYALDPDIDNVLNEELEDLSAKIGVSYITLFKQTEDDIVGLKSSDPKERDLPTKEWGFWYAAFQQLFEHHKVTIPEGQKLPNYWAGPMGVSASDPTHIDKWGYYYDGTTNYIINPYVRDRHILNISEQIGPEAIVRKTLENSHVLLEVTGINPKTFGREPIYTYSNGQIYVDLFNKDILFGDYHYKNEKKDISSVNSAIRTGQLVSYRANMNGKDVLKSFIPIFSERPYVIAFVSDYSVIQEVLDQQMYNNIMISILLLFIVFCLSSILSGYIVKPLHHIVHKVNKIADGDYDTSLKIGRKDELGVLSESVNTMSLNLKNYKKTEEILLKSEKLSVAGQLAAGVAHEIRNPLTSIQGFVQLLQERDTENKEYLHIMKSELFRIEQIVNEFLVLAKPQAIKFKEEGLQEVLLDVIRLLDPHATMHHINFKIQFEQDYLIKCDENQLKQVFINIVKNAIEAMPNGGTIDILVKKHSDNKLLIQFKDQGYGIDAVNLAKLGEPFYTTKEEGTGLGLMVSHRIIENHDGSIQFNSEVGKGTTVDIFLPYIGIL